MTFRLFVDSSTGVDVHPEWNYAEKSKKVESRHRARDGSEYVYKWGDIELITFEIKFVNSSFKAQVNSWWGGNVDLLWMEEGGTAVSSVHIISKTKPISGLQRPYINLFKGKIELGSY